MTAESHSEPCIGYTSDAGIARLVISQPEKMNAMTFEMWRSLPELVARAEADPDVRVLAMTGAGDKAFCAGADISQFGEKRSGDGAVRLYDEAVQNGMDALLKAQKPTVALVRGVCFGGGCALALSCDLRLARDDARFRVPAGRLGLGYGYTGIEMMVAKIGMAAVADIMLSARILYAAAAEQRNLVHFVWSRKEFESEAEAYLGSVAENAPLTLRAIKKTLVELTLPESHRNKVAVDQLVAACFQSEDYKEGQAAFREKRKPHFRGR